MFIQGIKTKYFHKRFTFGKKKNYPQGSTGKDANKKLAPWKYHKEWSKVVDKEQKQWNQNQKSQVFQTAL